MGRAVRVLTGLAGGLCDAGVAAPEYGRAGAYFEAHTTDCNDWSAGVFETDGVQVPALVAVELKVGGVAVRGVGSGLDVEMAVVVG